MWIIRDRAAGSTTGAEMNDATPRLAVLYFDTEHGDSSLEEIAEGLTDELILELSGVNGFRVISRNGVRPYRDRQVPFDSLVAGLRANLIVDGSVSRSGNRIRARAQLIDARSNTYVDSLTFEWPAVEPTAVEQALAKELAARLRRQMGRQLRVRQAGTGTHVKAAAELARKAQRDWEDGVILAEQSHPRDLATALELMGSADSLLRLAYRADPSWVRVLIDRGWIARDRSLLLGGRERLSTLEAGVRLAEEAVRRAPDDPGALELRGALRWLVVTELQAASGEPDRVRRAETDLRRALDLDSTRVRAWTTLSDLLWYKGNTAEASLAAERAAAEDTYLTEARSVLVQLMYDDLMLGRYARAGEWCRRGRWTFPGNWRFVECELVIMRHDADATPNPDSAWKLVSVLDTLDPPDKAVAEGRRSHLVARRMIAATISARAGRRGRARAEIARARQATAADSAARIDLAYDEAYLRLVLGEREQATRLLADYIRARPLAREYLARDPLFRGLAIPPAPGPPTSDSTRQ